MDIPPSCCEARVGYFVRSVTKIEQEVDGDSRGYSTKINGGIQQDYLWPHPVELDAVVWKKYKDPSTWRRQKKRHTRWRFLQK